MNLVPVWMLITGTGLLQYAWLQARILKIQRAGVRSL